ncbi:hypothetical protein OG948_33925 [Embleya sp. NBC_00888]|uniref:hypothetical protein n=1 Tax=Embleya sp. NBC_00888 TaxID=2975960 RepID=UPI00386B2BB4|nr:hypothetical protein OG948_33925 [Embleya sp. NBC_00888]
MGLVSGALAWGMAGIWRSTHESNYPWNVWIPIGYGAVKGVFLGLAMGWCAVLLTRKWGCTQGFMDRRIFAAVFLLGLLPGTYQDLTGSSPRLVYFEDSTPDDRWYWNAFATQWITGTVLPAFGCALVVASFAAFSGGSSRKRLMSFIGVLVTGVGGVLLIFLPALASAGAPSPEGNGQHVDESAITAMGVTLIGLCLVLRSVMGLISAVKRRRRLHEVSKAWRERRRISLSHRCAARSANSCSIPGGRSAW